MMAAFFLGPKTRSPFSSNTSTIPPTRGSSMPITVRSIFSLTAKEAMASKSMGLIGTHFATLEMPAFPGAQKISSTFFERLMEQQRACSLPPLPTTRIFIDFYYPYLSFPSLVFSLLPSHNRLLRTSTRRQVLPLRQRCILWNSLRSQSHRSLLQRALQRREDSPPQVW